MSYALVIAGLTLLYLLFYFVIFPFLGKGIIEAQKGWEEVKKRNWEIAFDYFDRAIELNANLATAYHGRALARQQLKDFDGAIADCQRLLELDPSRKTQAYLIRAGSYAKLGKVGESIGDFTEFIQRNPQDATGYLSRAEAYKKLNRTDKALADLSYVIDNLRSKNFIAYSERALIYFHSENYHQAIDDLKMVLTFDIAETVRYGTFSLLASSYNRTGRYDDLLAVANRMIEFAPLKSFPFVLRGEGYRHTKQYKLALDDFYKALELDKSLTLYEPIAVCLLQLERYSEALEAVNHFISWDPDYPSGYTIRGRIYMKQHQYDEARKNFERATVLKPQDTYTLYKLGTCLLQLEQADEALQVATQLIEIDSNDSSYFNLRGSAYLGLHNFENAQAAFNKALILRKDNPSPYDYNNLGLIDLINSNYERALQYFNRAIDIDNTEPMFWCNRARIYLLMKIFEKVQADIDHTFILNSSYAPAYDLRACLYFLNGNYEAALDDFQIYQQQSAIPRIWGKLIGSAVTHFALDNKVKALELWRQVVEDKPELKDIKWVAVDTLWPQEMLEVVQQLIDATSE